MGGSNRHRPNDSEGYTEPLSKNFSSNPLSELDDCSNFTLHHQLNRIDPKALSKVKRGDTLSVELDTKGFITVSNNDGEVCGYLAHPKAYELLTCIKKGNTFIAIVLDITGVVCQVMVKNSQS